MSRPSQDRAGRRPLWIFVALLSVVLAACSQAGPYDTLAPAGPVAEKQKDLFVLVFWIAVGVFVLVEGALVYATFRFRQRRREELPAQVHGNTRLEIIWTILPALILAGVAVPTVATIFEQSRVPENALEITVTAHQWWWEIEYPEQEGITQEVVTANEVHIPVDEPVYLTLTSEDVIHSFWVPRLAGKQDMIPGRTENLVIQADAEKTYLGQCAELCGLSHANMKFVVVAESQADFDAWLEAQALPATDPANDSDAGQGLETFRTAGCIACHAIEGVEGAEQQIGPDLSHFGSRSIFAGGILENTPENLARWLDRPGDVKIGARMRDYGLTEDQIEDLVAYLESLE